MAREILQPAALLILDGWGVAEPGPGNAIFLAETPVFERLLRRCPWTTLGASGLDVGLPEGQMGNSEVGHTNIGAGRVVYQDLTRISKAITEGRLTDNPALDLACTAASRPGCALHLLGLLSDGGVHSHQEHLEALIALAVSRGLERVYIHAFLDGRDTPPDSGRGYLLRLEEFLARTGCGRVARVASIGGRFYGMDRDRRWERIERHWRTLVLGEGEVFPDSLSAIDEAYARQVYDEFVEPRLIVPMGEEKALISDGDGVIFFNFRGDRAREITLALTRPDFHEFARPCFPELGAYVCLTEYDASFGLPVAFPPVELVDVLGEVVASRGLSQLRIAETEKYAHVTFFFNGGREEPFPGEERCLVPSPREIKTYDQKPEMSAAAVVKELCRRLDEKRFELVVLNFANCDMVGHTGVLPAAIRACTTVDRCLGRVLAKLEELGYAALVTADHGNAEYLLDAEGHPVTAHSTNPVPLILVGSARPVGELRSGGILADVAPTLLEIMGLEKPSAMSGRSLLKA